ncbi:type IV toxin-antitoxin system AbiEi family antitoxin domain-containing protein [Xylanimonas sp. McL0601]|uniref:type IV toxin-antitoxin system AbiEi family antitoxin domain-containing protein n=1 Tax=Xylanimonas sp. McL0601 TaxID=3414739 RepID=UPI003CEEFEA0
MSRPRLPLPADLLETVRGQEGLVSTAQCVAAGVNRQRVGRLVTVGALVRRRRRVYEVVGALPLPTSDGAAMDRARLQRAIEGPLAHGPTAVATGLAALVLAGAMGAPRDFAPEVAFLQGSSSSATTTGVRIRRTPVGAVMSRHGIHYVTPEVALAQVVPEVERWRAVALMDSVRHQKILSERQFGRARASTAGRRGAARTRAWWGECDPRSESPAETKARLDCMDAGIPPDAVQLTVRSPGRAVGRIDLAWYLPDGTWLLVEIDGIQWHQDRRDVLRDLTRQNRIITSRTLLRRYTGTEAMNGTLVREIADILATRSWRPGVSAPAELVVA